jgi:Protein of unknown function (DUF3179)
VWETTVNGRVLHFHIAGINNQNFIMIDEETGSWWQQVTGTAILGPLQGTQLRPVVFDELSFGLWKHENAGGRVRTKWLCVRGAMYRRTGRHEWRRRASCPGTWTRHWIPGR